MSVPGFTGDRSRAETGECEAIHGVARHQIAALRREDLFPVLDADDMKRMARFGEPRRFSAGDLLKKAGERPPGLFVLIAGRVTVKQRNAFGMQLPVAEHGPGEFMGEVGQLGGAASFTDAQAIDEVEALVIPADRLRALIIGEAALGERVIRALILRRALLIESESSGPVLIGRPLSPEVLRLQSFLRRNAVPYQKMPVDASAPTTALLDQYGATADDVTAVCPNGAVLVNPDEAHLARCIGMLETRFAPSASMSSSSAPVRPASLQPCMRHPKGSTWSSSTAVTSAARPAPARASKTISAFRPASRGWLSPVARLSRRRSSGRRS